MGEKDEHLINEEECRAAGLDLKRIDSLARRLRRLSREMEDLSIVLFGGSGSGSLRYDDGTGKGRLILADVGCNTFDGGDGATRRDENGLERGE